MNDTSRWPVDYDTLEKGDTVTRERLEQITGERAGSKGYQLKAIGLQSQIERELHSRGKLWTVKIEREEIRILTDPEASSHNHALQIQARKAMQKRFALNTAVDVAKLDDEQKKQHDRLMEVDGKYIQAITAVRQQLRLASHRRTVPALS